MQELAFKIPINYSPYQKPNLLEFLGRPDTALSWMLGISNTDKLSERSKEDRVEGFWRGLSILGGIGFFAGYLIQRTK